MKRKTVIVYFMQICEIMEVVEIINYKREEFITI
jgi:hypothetical protein